MKSKIYHLPLSIKVMSTGIKIVTVVYIFIFGGHYCFSRFAQHEYLFDFVGKFPHADKIGHFILMGTLRLPVNLALNAKTIVNLENQLFNRQLDCFGNRYARRVFANIRWRKKFRFCRFSG